MDSSAPASVRDDEPCDAEVHPGPECAHTEATVQSCGRLGGYGELDGARDDLATWAADAPGRSEIQVEDRLRLTDDGRGKPLRNRIDDEVGKRDTRAAVSIGQPAGVINGSGERRYDNLATADREEQRRLRGCRGMAVTVMPGCLRVADVAGFTTTWVLLLMTVALADVYRLWRGRGSCRSWRRPYWCPCRWSRSPWRSARSWCSRCPSSARSGSP
jgi:hypothetical protein